MPTVVPNAVYARGDDVLVNNGCLKEEKRNPDIPDTLQGNWAARILEIRARDEANVYLLVNYYNRPEDLPIGTRKPWQGMNEILATNEVSIIDPSKNTSISSMIAINDI